jgi:hypothetical protein
MHFFSLSNPSFIRSRTRDLPFCIIVSYPLRYRVLSVVKFGPLKTKCIAVDVAFGVGFQFKILCTLGKESIINPYSKVYLYRNPKELEDSFYNNTAPYVVIPPGARQKFVPCIHI